MRWRVANSIGAEGLPVEAWAAAARARLQGEPAIERADIAASRDQDGGEFDVLTVDVLVRESEPRSAAELVKREVVAALWDVVGDDEVGWTAYDWEVTPAGG